MKRVAMGWAVLALALTVAGCAAPQSQFPAVDAASNESEARKQREVVLRDALEARLRLMDVANPLLMAATPICPDDRSAERRVGTECVIRVDRGGRRNNKKKKKTKKQDPTEV